MNIIAVTLFLGFVICLEMFILISVLLLSIVGGF